MVKFIDRSAKTNSCGLGKKAIRFWFENWRDSKISVPYHSSLTFFLAESSPGARGKKRSASLLFRPPSPLPPFPPPPSPPGTPLPIQLLPSFSVSICMVELLLPDSEGGGGIGWGEWLWGVGRGWWVRGWRRMGGIREEKRRFSNRPLWINDACIGVFDTTQP